MKKFYYITIIASVAIICFQANYIRNLHSNYLDEKISTINEVLRTAIEEEFDLRTRGKIVRERRVFYKRGYDMTSEEKDNYLTLSSKNDTIINMAAAQKAGIGQSVDDIIFQVEQDRAMGEGLYLDLKLLDSLYINLFEAAYPHIFINYNQNKIQTAKFGEPINQKSNYRSELYPIGTKGLQYIQIEVFIPMSEFIKNQFWMLALSAGFMLIVLLCLLYQLIEIRNKNRLLIKRETSVNGTIHDLKTPLNSVVTMLSWFKAREKDANAKQIIERSQSSVKHLISNIESLLVTARKDRQKLILNKTSIDILSLVNSVISELSLIYQNKKHGIKVTDELPDNIVVLADSMYIENVMRNLIENSLKYSDEEVRVDVILSISENMLKVCVKDNGWGIPLKYQRKLFQQFYQVPRNRDKSINGYGIGLAFVKSIIQEHGGQITVESSENSGSVFTFTLPYSTGGSYE